MWGSVSGTAASAEPTVFRLTGMSAEDVKQVASEVSQELTGADERAWLERSGPMQPVVGVPVESTSMPGTVPGVLV